MKPEKPDFERVLAPRVSGAAASDHVSAGPAWEAFDVLFNSNPQPMWIYERKILRFLAVNEAAVEKYGYSKNEFLRMTLADIRPPEDVPRLKEATAGDAVIGYHVSSGWRHRTKDGSTVYVTVHTHDVTYHGREAVLVMAADVTELIHAIGQLEKQRAWFTQLFENSPEGIVLLDRDGTIIEANAGFQNMFGYTLEELVGHTPLSLIVPASAAEESMTAFTANVDRNEVSRVTSVRRKKNGELINVEVLAYPVQIKGEPRSVFAIYQNVTEKYRALREIEFQARHDTLTGLANRAYLVENIRLLLQRDGGDRKHAFLFIDLDQFKVINDSCGHSVGDKALIEVGRLLRDTVREDDLVARLGGDEFAVLLPDCDQACAQQRAEELLAKIGAFRFAWEGQTFLLGASIGVVELREDMTSVENVLSAGDVACYAAKDSGRNRVMVYRSNDEFVASRKNDISWVAKLRTALEEDRFVLFFQKLEGLSEAARRVSHREVLLRYRNDDGSLVPPGAFVPSAERYHLMPAIDRWVLNATCERIARLPAGGDGERIFCINISGTTFSDEKFVGFVKQTLAATGVAASVLCFEITETAAISNLQAAKRLITELRVLGSSIALDDFGCGMSSFNYLRTLTVDYLKIDGTFVRDMHDNAVDRAMTEAINHLGKILGLKTIAEFVENREIRKVLEEIGVDYAQGYGVHMPEPWND